MKRLERKYLFWLPPVILCLVIGICWVGYRKVEAQQRADRLFTALRQADIAAVQRALDAGAEPNACQTPGQKPTGFFDIVKQLFFESIHPDYRETALTAAVYLEDPKFVRLLLDRGAVPNLRNDDGSTPLMATASINHCGSAPCFRALTQQQMKMMQMLLDKGADINEKRQDGSTALSYSVRDGIPRESDLTVPRFLLEHGADADAKGWMGETLLQEVAAGQDKNLVPFVNLLLDHGAKVNAKDSLGWTPLMRASEWIEPSLVQTLLKHGADPNSHLAANDMTPLIQAARQGQIGTMKLLLDRGADVNAFSVGDGTALFIAAQHKRADMIKLLLGHGANPNYVNKIDGCEPALIVAAGNQDVPSVTLLIRHGADVNLGGEDDTPLTSAANTYLINAYAKHHKNIWDSGDVSGILPVSPPCGIAVTQMLLAAGADPNKPDQAGNTALVYAVAGHNTPLVRLLLAHGANPMTHGANPYVPESAEETPLILATQRGYSDLILLLQENPHSAQ